MSGRVCVCGDAVLHLIPSPNRLSTRFWLHRSQAGEIARVESILKTDMAGENGQRINDRIVEALERRRKVRFHSPLLSYSHTYPPILSLSSPSLPPSLPPTITQSLTTPLHITHTTGTNDLTRPTHTQLNHRRQWKPCSWSRDSSMPQSLNATPPLWSRPNLFPIP